MRGCWTSTPHFPHLLFRICAMFRSFCLHFARSVCPSPAFAKLHLLPTPRDCGRGFSHACARIARRSLRLELPLGSALRSGVFQTLPSVPVQVEECCHIICALAHSRSCLPLWVDVFRLYVASPTARPTAAVRRQGGQQPGRSRSLIKVLVYW